MEWVSYSKLHSEHRGSIYHHNRTTGQSRTGYTFTNPKPDSRYVTLLRNLLIHPQVTPDELYWYTYHDCRKEPMPEGFKKVPGRMSCFYAALHEEGLITYSRYPAFGRLLSTAAIIAGIIQYFFMSNFFARIYRKIIIKTTEVG